MKICFVVPSPDVLGGVSNHYKGLHRHWTLPFTYSIIGKRPHVPAILTLIPDVISYTMKLMFGGVDVVVVNPSLRWYQLRRDGIYATIARLFGKRVVTFIHGWDNEVAGAIVNSPSKFRKTFGKSAFIYVLYSGFRDKLLRAGVDAPVLLTTTKVADELVDKFDISERKGNVKNLLFLARLEKSKGIMIVLEAYRRLKQEYPELTLSVCGSGDADADARQFVADNGLDGVTFHGTVSGEALVREFRNADVYLFPTSHGEGMATSVLEAMAFGLPVIMHPVGGVKDFFVDGEMGYMIDSLAPEAYVEALRDLIKNPEKARLMSVAAHDYAVNRFLASRVAKSIEDDLIKYCGNI